MISIIICSRTVDIPKKLRDNITTTIGAEHEIVVLDNSLNDHSIFTAYNLGVRRSKGDILCFCHDDILFHTDSWGTTIEDLFRDDTIGEIGVIGSHFMPAAPLYWWSSPYISQYSINNDDGNIVLNDTRVFFRGHFADVVAVDGVCFFIPKSLFTSIRFDEGTYKGFHAYDMDISMQIQQLGKRVCVTDALTIEHFWSEKSINNQKYMAQLNANMRLFYQKWKEHLPIVRGLNEPQIVIERLNNLCIQAYDSNNVRESRAYRLGRFLLSPLKLFKK